LYVKRQKEASAIRECVASCDVIAAHESVFNRCVESSNTTAFGVLSLAKLNVNAIIEELLMCWAEIVGISFVSLAFSFMILALYRYATNFIVWFICISSIATFSTLSVVMFVLFLKAIKNEVMKEVLAFGICFCIAWLATIVLVLVVVFLRKKLQLTIQLFKEASKLLTDIPMLLVEPLLVMILMMSMSELPLTLIF